MEQRWDGEEGPRTKGGFAGSETQQPDCGGGQEGAGRGGGRWRRVRLKLFFAKVKRKPVQMRRAAGGLGMAGGVPRGIQEGGRWARTGRGAGCSLIQAVAGEAGSCAGSSAPRPGGVAV